MSKKKNKLFIVLVLLAAVVFIFVPVRGGCSKKKPATRQVNPSVGDIHAAVSTTGVVEPQNRLELKPPINGRIEDILVREGDKVTRGQILAWMSSTERAALLDAARAQGEEKVRYWEDVYKATPLISPIDGEVIVRVMEPGQTVTSANAVLVLSDRLIISAQFDETDIARIRVGQRALIALDAYPEVKLEGTVDHIAYESEIVNNVTIYDVDILPSEVPEILRSGMSVTVEVIEKAREDTITVPAAAIHYDGKRAYVFVRERSGKITERDVTVGIKNEKAVEILSGLAPEDHIVIKDESLLPKRKSSGTNPFMPSRRNR